MKIIGRLEEQKVLQECLQAGRPEFLVVYGRRRIGKTFLVRETFKGRFCFAFTGYAGVTTTRQLARFHVALREYGADENVSPQNWYEAFDQLRQLIEKIPRKGKKVVFLDEMPWMDTKRSEFINALEGFWNGWASGRDDILLIACGSATSWITKKLFKNRGGLHNRVTKRIHLQPFTLGECEEYFKSRGMVYDRRQILEAYMILGGIPYYLDQFDGSRSIAQNIDWLCFSSSAPLSDEYDALYASLFSRPERYVEIVEALAKKAKGLTRSELLKATNAVEGGSFTKTLDELEQCGFIRKFKEFGKRSKGSIYQLMDPFTLFHLRFMRRRSSDSAGEWLNDLQTGQRNAWSGYAFETVCLWHIAQIKHSLGITGVTTDVSAWRSDARIGEGSKGAQIDLVIDRADGLVNLCEMKYTVGPYVISRDYAQWLGARKEIFREETRTKKTLHLTMVTADVLSEKGHRHCVQSAVTLDDLFA